ncbi:LacI family DNA-binding transcriptional regulator [Demequina sp. NBRC 110056]|uniref:LacI family DNA-binding transcriptional regulator n=1 Tax=Demequina sp. NBRC 110056 TaxID=1570345 RepID=UPI001F486DB2|nr:LacI family DNA-binding transcriptional regulator [Demequina sp. NBRC 110056]
METVTHLVAAGAPEEAVGMGRVTLKTVAEAVGVSRMTVSNAFSKPDQLSPDLRERILETAAELGYLGPDPAARALARGSVGAVGVVLTDSLEGAFLDPVSAAFFGAVADTLAPTGLAVSLIPAARAGDHLAARDLPIDGALVCACDVGQESVEWLRRRGLPLVFVDNEALPGYARVGLDEREGGRLAAQHLIDLGHTDIAIFTIDPSGAPGWVDDPTARLVNTVADERRAGAVEAISAAGLMPRMLTIEDNDEAHALPGARELLGGAAPTGVVSFSDDMAAAVIGAAREASIAVPAELSVVGFDDAPIARAVTPGLTTIRQDFRAKGRAAAEALVSAIAAQRESDDGPVPAADGEHRIAVPVELVVRDSTAAARGTT